MIKLENVVPASLEQMEFIIQGMRNPMNSWEKSDSGRGCDGKLCGSHCAFSSQWCGNTPKYVVGEADHSLMQRLSNAGTEHRKYLRMMPVYVRITAPLYWWKEFDNTYVAGIVNKYKNYFGKSRVVVIKSQLGQPIVAYSGDEVYWKIPKDLPKMTKLMIDGRALYIHRANFQIIDTALLG